MRILKTILLIILVVLVVFVLGRNIIVKAVLEGATPLVTGLGLSVEKLNIGLFDTKLHIVNLRMTNPKNFEEKVMLDLPEVLVDYNLMDILGGKIHLSKIVFALKEFKVVRNSEGVLNLDSLKMVKEGKEAEKPKEKPVAKKEAKPLDLQIDEFILKFGKIQFIDYSRNAAQPSVQTVEVNLDETYKNITNPQLIAAIIMQKVIRNAALAKITGFDLGGIQGAMTNVVGNVDQLAAGALSSAKDLSAGALKSTKDLADGLKGSVSDIGGTVEGIGEIGGAATEKAGETVQAAGDALKGLSNKLKLPFGSKE
jgi:hypothetical protein